MNTKSIKKKINRKLKDGETKDIVKGRGKINCDMKKVERRMFQLYEEKLMEKK